MFGSDTQLLLWVAMKCTVCVCVCVFGDLSALLWPLQLHLQREMSGWVCLFLHHFWIHNSLSGSFYYSIFFTLFSFSFWYPNRFDASVCASRLLTSSDVGVFAVFKDKHASRNPCFNEPNMILRLQQKEIIFVILFLRNTMRRVDVRNKIYILDLNWLSLTFKVEQSSLLCLCVFVSLSVC